MCHSHYCACSPLCWRSEAEGEEKEFSGKGCGVGTVLLTAGNAFGNGSIFVLRAKRGMLIGDWLTGGKQYESKESSARAQSSES